MAHSEVIDNFEDFVRVFKIKETTIKLLEKEDLNDLDALKKTPLYILVAVSNNFTVGQKTAFMEGLEKIKNDFNTEADRELRLKQLDAEIAYSRSRHELQMKQLEAKMGDEKRIHELEMAKIEADYNKERDKHVTQREEHKNNMINDVIKSSKSTTSEGARITRKSGWFSVTVTSEIPGTEETGLKAISDDKMKSLKALSYN